MQDKWVLALLNGRFKVEASGRLGRAKLYDKFETSIISKIHHYPLFEANFGGRKWSFSVEVIVQLMATTNQLELVTLTKVYLTLPCWRYCVRLEISISVMILIC